MSEPTEPTLKDEDIRTAVVAGEIRAQEDDADDVNDTDTDGTDDTDADDDATDDAGDTDTTDA